MSGTEPTPTDPAEQWRLGATTRKGHGPAGERHHQGADARLRPVLPGLLHPAFAVQGTDPHRFDAAATGWAASANDAWECKDPGR
jgi:hypothetical protein